MIEGMVNPYTEAEIPVVVLGPEGRMLKLTAIIDTGFSGYLTLPQEIIVSLGLPYFEGRTFLLGNNTEVTFAVYEAVVSWTGVDREIQVLASEAHPLVGMALLKGYQIFIDAIDGGRVSIEDRG